MAYQRKVSRFLRKELSLLQKVRRHELPLRSRDTIYVGQWLRFEDSNGPGYAQPDIFIHAGSRIIVFECKLTRVGAFEQIALLYWPLLWHIFKVPLVGIEVFLNSGPGYEPHPKSPSSLTEALSLTEWTLAEWHLLL